MVFFFNIRGMFEHVERKNWNALAPLKLDVSFLRKKFDIVGDNSSSFNTLLK